jgi:hypothetical protein
MKLAVPIFVDGQFLGVAGGCGHILENGEVDTFMVNKTIGIDEGKLNDLSVDIPVMKMEKAQELAQFIQHEVDQIIDA